MAVVRTIRGFARHIPITSPAPALPGGRGSGHPFYAYPPAVPPDVTTGWGGGDVGPTAVAPADSLRRTSPPDPIHVTVAAMDAILPIAYGSQTLDALIANALIYEDSWIWWVWWCEGPIAGIDEVKLNDHVFNDIRHHGVPADITNYLGGDDNVVDPLLVAAYAAQDPPIAFNEAVPGVAHSVLRVKTRHMQTAPKFQAKMRGRLLYDPRGPTTAYSNNPSLVLADFLVSKCAATMDWDSVADAADANDALIGTAPNQEKSRTCDILLAQASTPKDWKETLRTAAGVFIVENQGTVKLVPDVAGSVVAAYSHDAGNIIAISDLSLPDSTQLPTVIDVTYTDTTKTPWAEDTAPPVYRPGADSGAIPWRRSTVPMPWIQSRSQAYREAVERMNKLWLRGLTFTAELFGEGLRHEVGDIITIDYPEHGLNTLKVKVAGIQPTGNATWLVRCQKEDEGCYSDVVQANPTTPNTQLPAPTAPPAPTGLTWTEELYVDALGKVKSRMRALWDDVGASYPYFSGYRVEVYTGDTLMGEPTLSRIPELAWGPVQEGLSYSINVYTLSPVAASDVAQATTVAAGKLLPPGDVPYLFVYEAGGEVRFQWLPALDLDVAAHELRYGPVGSATWSNATLLDRVAMPQRTYTTRSIPPGDYRFFIKALDSIRSAAFPNGQESAAALAYDLDVGGDPNVFIADVHDFTSATLTNAVEVQIGAETRWVSDYGDSVADAFTTTPLADNYPNPMILYSGSGTSTLLTDTYDFGATYSGQLIATLAYQNLSGTATLYVETSPDNSSWTQHTGPVAAAADFRYVRVRLETTGFFLATSLGQVQLSVVTVPEYGEATTNGSGVATVTLSRVYTQVKSIQLTPEVSSGLINTGYLNVTTGNPTTFDIKTWNASNAVTSATVKWLFQGI